MKISNLSKKLSRSLLVAALFAATHSPMVRAEDRQFFLPVAVCDFARDGDPEGRSRVTIFSEESVFDGISSETSNRPAIAITETPDSEHDLVGRLGGAIAGTLTVRDGVSTFTSYPNGMKFVLTLREENEPSHIRVEQENFEGVWEVLGDENGTCRLNHEQGSVGSHN